MNTHSIHENKRFAVQKKKTNKIWKLNSYNPKCSHQKMDIGELLSYKVSKNNMKLNA